MLPCTFKAFKVNFSKFEGLERFEGFERFGIWDGFGGFERIIGKHGEHK